MQDILPIPLKKPTSKDNCETHMKNQLSQNYTDSIPTDVMCIGEIFMFSAKSTMFLLVANEVAPTPWSSITLPG